MGKISGIEEYVRVVQAGSFSGAARQLGMPASTLSDKIAGLEARLGINLILRTTRKLSITEEGQRFFQHCLRALNELELAEEYILASSQTPKGLVKIAAPPDIGHEILPPIIASYLQSYPQTQVELTLSSDFADLIEGRYDLAFRAGALKDSSLVARKFIDIEMALFASPNYLKQNGIPESPDDLSHYQVIFMKNFGEKIKLAHQNAIKTIKINSRIHLHDMESVKSFCKNGLGIGVLPTIICNTDIENGKLIRVLDKWRIKSRSSANLYLVYPQQKYLSPKVRKFIDLAISIYPL